MGFEERSDRKRGLQRSMRSVGDGYGHYPDCGDHGYIHQSKLMFNYVQFIICYL